MFLVQCYYRRQFVLHVIITNFPTCAERASERKIIPTLPERREKWREGKVCFWLISPFDRETLVHIRYPPCLLFYHFCLEIIIVFNIYLIRSTEGTTITTREKGNQQVLQKLYRDKRQSKFNQNKICYQFTQSIKNKLKQAKVLNSFG